MSCSLGLIYPDLFFIQIFYFWAKTLNTLLLDYLATGYKLPFGGRFVCQTVKTMQSNGVFLDECWSTTGEEPFFAPIISIRTLVCPNQ